MLVLNNTMRKLSIEEIFALADELVVREKAELVERLLGESGLSVALDSDQLLEQAIVQINKMSREDLGDILKAIATRISSEGK